MVPRPRGPHGRENSVARAIRLPDDLNNDVEAAMAREGLAFPEWLRSVIRKAVGRRLNFDAGYEEGKAQGWADAQARLREAIKGA